MPITPTEHIWMNGEMVPWEQATTHVLTHTLHYGTGVFEGIRAYETSDGPGVFRLTEHMERLHASAKIMMMDLPYSVEELVEATKEVVADSGLPSCYIRPIAYFGYGEMGLNTLPCSVDVSIACWPWGAYLGDGAVTKGVRMKTSSWKRHDHKRDATVCQDDRQLRELIAGQGGGSQGRLRRGDHVEPGGPGL
ncbi:MAG: aminotransferase class IV [Microthrixaceae bacterium]